MVIIMSIRNEAKLIKNNKLDIVEATFTQPKKKRRLLKFVLRSFLCLFTLLIVLIGGAFGAVAVVNYGPSQSARDLFVMSVMETSAAKFLATWYFSDEEINAIIANNSVEKTTEVTNTDLVVINNIVTDPEFDKNKIEIVDVEGATFKGKMMVINDPSRVSVGTCPNYGDGYFGTTLAQMIKDTESIGGANGGGFDDTNGKGTGAIPLGIVFSNGELKWGELGYSYEVIGFDDDNKLIVGYMTGQQAIDKNIRDAVSFGPLLIVNGEPVEVSGTGGGLNPRTAIGQKADGTVLLLVIDGRQANSLGASYSDLIDVFLQFGAVNAGNLDGGSSSHMIYQDEIVTQMSSLYGARKMPTSILVK